MLGRALLIPDPEVVYASAQALIGYLARAGRFALPGANTAVGHNQQPIRFAAKIKLRNRPPAIFDREAAPPKVRPDPR